MRAQRYFWKIFGIFANKLGILSNFGIFVPRRDLVSYDELNFHVMNGTSDIVVYICPRNPE